MTHIIILNWNGWRDTLACIDSLLHCEGEFHAYIADNGSTDESVARIAGHIASLPQFSLIENHENMGFARGNNHVLRQIASRIAPTDRILLLNNDTTCEPDFLTRLSEFDAAHPEVQVLTPLICYYSEPDLVWNCGGTQRFGLRRYHYAHQHVGDIKEKGHIDVTFLTGCALYVRPECLLEDGSLLTERFFFGEEDFEFCLRMNRAGRKMACVLTSRIYHKVNASQNDRSPLSRIYIYYLNRYIDIWLNYDRAFNLVWRPLTFFYTFILLLRKRHAPLRVIRMLSNIHRLSRTKTSVTREDYLNASRDWA